MSVKQILNYLSQSDLDDTGIENINSLLKQLTDKPKTIDREMLEKVLNQSGVSILVLKELDGTIIGMATLAVRQLLLNKTGIIGDVVMDEKYRGKKLGKIMMQVLITKAKEEEVSFVSLTSHPSREAANYLYQNLGFKLIGKVGESNYYRLPL